MVEATQMSTDRYTCNGTLFSPDLKRNKILRQENTFVEIQTKTTIVLPFKKLKEETLRIDVWRDR